jgi:hypothetical protein
VRAAAGFVNRDGDLAVGRAQHVQNDAALERPLGRRGNLLGLTGPG